MLHIGPYASPMKNEAAMWFARACVGQGWQVSAAAETILTGHCGRELNVDPAGGTFRQGT